MLFYYLIFISLIGSVHHKLKVNNTWLIAHANENASDIHSFRDHSFSDKCHSIQISEGLKYPMSPGAGATYAKVTVGEWHEISLGFMNCNFQIHSKQPLNQIIHFPPAYLHKGGLHGKCESISSMFVKCLESDGDQCGLVAVGYDVKKHVEFLGYSKTDLDKVQLQIPEDQENHILVYYSLSSINLIMNVRVTEGTDLEAIYIAQSECNEELKAIALIYDSLLKENEMILCGVVAAPNIDLQKQEMSTFPCQKCVSINLILSEQELSSTDHLQSWWGHFIERINEDIVEKYDSFNENKLESKDLFYSVGSQILAIMSAVSTYLPSLHGKTDEKICTILLNKEQLHAINDAKKKKIIRGAYGSGKSIVGKEIVRSICLTNKPRTLVYYICFDKHCLLDYQMRNERDLMLTTNPSKVVVIVNNMFEIIEKFRVRSIKDLLTVLYEEKRNAYDEFHFVIDEVDGECITSEEASSLGDLFQNHKVLKDSIVVLLIQPMEKHRRFTGSNPKSHDSNCFDIEGMQTFQLDRSMRNTMQINEVLKVAQSEITKEPNEYNYGKVQNKQDSEIVKLTQDIGFVNQDIGSVNQGAHTANEDEERHNQDEMKKVNLTEDVDKLAEKMEEPNEYNHKAVQSKQASKIFKPTKGTEDIGSVNQDEQKHSQDETNINVTEDVDMLAEKMDAATRGKSSVTTVTNFIYNGECVGGHSIPGDKPKVVFLEEPYTEVRIPVSKVLAVFLKHVIESKVISPRVVICNDIHGLKLLERIFSLIKNVNSVTYAPWMLRKFVTKEERDLVFRNFTNGYVLLTDNKGFRGMEEKEVLIFLEKNEYYHRHYLPESICRATAKLSLIVVEKPNDNAAGTLPTLRELLDKNLDELVERIQLCTEEVDGIVKAIRKGKGGKTYYVNTSSEDFKHLDLKMEHSSIVVPNVEDEKQYFR